MCSVEGKRMREVVLEVDPRSSLQQEQGAHFQELIHSAIVSHCFRRV